MLNAFTENSRLDDDEDDGDGDGDSDGDGDGDDDSFDDFRAHDELGTCMTSLGCFTFVGTVLKHVLNRTECAES